MAIRILPQVGKLPQQEPGAGTMAVMAGEVQALLDAYGQPLMAAAFALPCFLMARHLWRVWRNPMAVEDGAWVRLGVGVFVMEFILVHAGILLAAAAEGAATSGGRLAGLLGLTAFYLVFALAISAAFGSRRLFEPFIWLIGSRYLALLIGVTAATERLLLAHAIMAMAIYFPLVILSVFLPWPRFGITAEVAAARRVPNSRGTWVDEPHRAIGAATVYYLLLGLAQIGVMSWIDPRALT